METSEDFHQHVTLSEMETSKETDLIEALGMASPIRVTVKKR
jgi:hypothetical protein